ncbi:MAG: hypothetical protein HRT37_23180 [Alteromonadaceae bacterium]|nr:hypothetical protein [Alteromonadaceae bacterium]
MTIEQIERINTLAEKLLKQNISDNELEEYLALMKLWRVSADNKQLSKKLLIP